MISVIKLNDRFVELLKDKKEIKIDNLIFCYKQVETLGSSLIIYLGDKTKEILLASSSDDIPVDNMIRYVLFKQDNNQSAIVLSENQWQFLQQQLFAYNIVDAEMSVKYSTIFYKSE